MHPVSLNYSKRPTSASPGISLVPSPPHADTLTYEPHFGLTEKAFSLNADPRFMYDSPTHVAAGEDLLAGIRRREGLLVLTGQIGTGKTTLCRAVLAHLGRDTYSSLVPDPFASREDLLKMLLVDFGVVSIQELTSGAMRQATRTELGYRLSEFLESIPRDAYVVVMIDEAQNLSLPLIEETRLLSDTFGAKGRLQIVFVGQPELHAKLKLPEMRQVDQRICGYHRLAPMDRDAVAGYIEHRLRAAGGRGDRVLFSPEIIEKLHARSGGVPRLINRVCDRALHLAYERRADHVDHEILDTALIEVGAATLSPTWDSIMFAEPAPPRPAVPAQPAAAVPTPPVPAPAAAPTPTVAPTPNASEIAALIGADDKFKKRVDHWLQQDLAPASRPLTSPPEAERRPASKTAAKREAPARTVRTDWPRDVRSETYLQKLFRKWAKRIAIALAVFVLLNAAILGASILPDLLTPPVLPAAPSAPAPVLPGLALPEAPPQ